MRNMTALKMMAGLVVASSVGVVFAGIEEMEKKEITTGFIQVTQPDVDVKISGRVREDWRFLDKIYTLRAGNDDQVSAFRSKSSLQVDGSFGRQTFGMSAADARIKLTNYGYWRNEGRYTPLLDAASPYDGYTTGVPLNMFTYMEEAWINLRFGTFFNAWNKWFDADKHGVDAKFGFFPYELGRGIALGDAWVSSPHLGWSSYGYDDTRYNQPGILFHTIINKDISFDLYYGKRAELSRVPTMNWFKSHQYQTDGRRAERGVGKDHDLWTARFDMCHSRPWGEIKVQPYMMYIDASETKVEFIADSTARLGNVGMMVDYKKGGFKVNAEITGQFGHQQMFAVDRNRIVEGVNAYTGEKTNVYDHIFYGSNGHPTTPGSQNAPTRSTTATAYDINSYRGVIYNGVAVSGAQVTVPSGYTTGVRYHENDSTVALSAHSVAGLGVADDRYIQYSDPKSVYNSDVTGNARFRNAYRIDYRGWMGVIDMAYEFEKVPVTIAAAGGYISGDNNPYNTEQDKRYKGFITYGDYNYWGKYVHSQIVIGSHKLARPNDLNMRKQYADIDWKDMSNLEYLGLGVQWKPFQDREKLTIESNLMWFWRPATMKKWDKDGTLPYHVVNSSRVFDVQGWSYTAGRQQYDRVWTSGGNPVGWYSSQDASRMLGTEWNIDIAYRPIKNCLFDIQFACFIPGQFYKDIDGMPTWITDSVVYDVKSPSNEKGLFGVGHDPVWQSTISLDFKF